MGIERTDRWSRKVSVPESPPGVVDRSALIDASRHAKCRVVGITAPAGYGKTTLLEQWAYSEPRPVAWVSLDPFDDDPGALLTLLGSAFAGAVPHVGNLVGNMRGSGVAVLGRAAPRLATALRASPVPFVMLLDDLQELQTSECHDVLDVVIAGIPQGSQLVTASRVEQPHVPRLRAAGDAFEVLVEDLAMDANEAEEIFAENHVDLTPEAAAVVTSRTEGWPVGLYLTSVIARDNGGIPEVTGQDPYLADYLYQEALAKVPQDGQRFLRSTAVLDQMSAPLCDALLDTTRSQEQLRQLEAANLFVTPLDRRRQWYRYHALFREFLLAELRRVEPEAITKLRVRAADWYESNGSPTVALEHLLQTDERDRCAKLAAQLALPTYSAGQMSTVKRWLTALGDAAVEEYPPLAVLAGWMAVMTGEAAQAERWAAVADAATFDLVPVDGTASFASATAMLRTVMASAGPQKMMEDASLAFAQEPAWSAWRDSALVLLAEALLLCGDPDRASTLFVEASSVAAVLGDPNNQAVSEAELALLAEAWAAAAIAGWSARTDKATAWQHRRDGEAALAEYTQGLRLWEWAAGAPGPAPDVARETRVPDVDWLPGDLAARGCWLALELHLEPATSLNIPEAVWPDADAEELVMRALPEDATRFTALRGPGFHSTNR